jgi:hypothetical protein
MIRYTALALIYLSVGILQAQVFIQPCDPCGLTSIEVHQVMAGKRCTLRISSDANDLWSGGLFLSGSDRELGILHGRNREPNSRDWAGSHLEHAGPMAKVYAWSDSEIRGFDFYNSEYGRREGTWFLIDYQALKPGNCKIGYYSHSGSWNQADPNLSITIENIPNVDFYPDDVIDLKDFMILASHWLAEDCVDPDWCDQTDIDQDGSVDIKDITLFAPYWLWGVSQDPTEPPAAPNTPEPAGEPNVPESPAEPNHTPEIPFDPNIIYSLHDANGQDEIVLGTGESIRLNISKQSLGIESISLFLEVFISDPNSGWIDNREYDPNDPNAFGKAEILAQPRMTCFDYYGPGYTQFEDILFSAVSFLEPMEDGSIASFVYTATRPGDVALLLIDYESIPSMLTPIIIHQVESGGAYSASGDPNDTVEFLENIWNTSPELQQANSWASWQAFLEAVRSTYSN